MKKIYRVKWLYSFKPYVGKCFVRRTEYFCMVFLRFTLIIIERKNKYAFKMSTQMCYPEQIITDATFKTTVNNKISAQKTV